MKNKSKPFYKKKKLIIPTLLVVALIGFRLYLPTLVKNQINKALDELEGYSGSLEDVDISLWRGAYELNDLVLNKTDGKSEIPFVNLPSSDISIEWKSLLNGRIVSEIVLKEAVITYVLEDHAEGSEQPEAEDWTKALEGIIPLDINRLAVNNGTLIFKQISAQPSIDLTITELALEATNMEVVKQKNIELPSSLTVTGKALSDGDLNVNGKFNLIKEIPDMDIALELKQAPMPKLNEASKYYAGIDFEAGIISVFAEFAMVNSEVKGYVKPIIEDLKFIGKEDDLKDILWEGVVSFSRLIIQNHKEGTIATKVPFEGNLENVETEVWPTVIKIFENAWVSAMESQVDNTVGLKDLLGGDKD